jgi:hypothetical protein
VYILAVLKYERARFLSPFQRLFLFYFLIATRWAAPLSSHAITNNDLALIFPTDKTNGASCLNS